MLLRRSSMPQLRPGTSKYINIKKKEEEEEEALVITPTHFRQPPPQKKTHTTLLFSHLWSVEAKWGTWTSTPVRG